MIPGLGVAGSATSPAATSAMGGLDGDTFLKLMVAQMRYQNPMSPSDPGAMMQQTAQFTQVETLKELSRTQQSLLGLTTAALSADMVGKHVTADGPDGLPIEGVVDRVRFTTDGPVIGIGDVEVPLANATTIRGTDAASPSTAPASRPEA